MTSFVNKRLSIYLTVFFLASYLSSCQLGKDLFPSEVEPQILAMSLPGVPNANISIDQQKKVITVILPDTLTSLELKPSFSVSKKASMFGKPQSIHLTNYCSCPTEGMSGNTIEMSVPYLVQTESSTKTYKIVLKNQKSLQLRSTTSPILYDSKSADYTIYLPVSNYYGSSYVKYIAVSKVGSLSPNWIGGGDGCFDMCSGRLNGMGISLMGYLVKNSDGTITTSLKSGSYDLDLWLIDDTKIHAAGAILVK